jgi:hypothetical protein
MLPILRVPPRRSPHGITVDVLQVGVPAIVGVPATVSPDCMDIRGVCFVKFIKGRFQL